MPNNIKHTERELVFLVEIYTWARRMTLTGGNHSVYHDRIIALDGDVPKQYLLEKITDSYLLM